MPAVETADLPKALAEIAQDFVELSVPERLQLLLEFSEELPQLPSRYADAPEKMEQVHECQSPVFLVVASSPDPAKRVVSLFFSAPQEAPTTRGFAGILREGLDQLTVQEVLAVPEDAPYRFGLAEAVSPLRLRGMVGMLGRIKRQTALKSTV